MISRRRFIKRASTAILSTSLLSNWVYSGSTPPSIEQTHVQIANLINRHRRRNQSLVILYPKGCLGNLKAVAKSFQEFTNIRLDLKEASLDQISSEMILEHRLKKRSFDVAIPATFGIPDLVEAGVIEDLTPFAKEYEPKSLASNALYTLGDYYMNKLYGYQTDGDTYLMFYNKKWLDNDAYKKEYEDKYNRALAIPKTWNELYQQMRFFHRPEENKFGGSLFRNKQYIGWEFWIRFHAKGYYPVRDDMTPQINNQAGIEALSELIETSKYLEPNVNKNGLFDNFKSFAQGNKYCNIGWGGTQKYLNGDVSKVKDQLYFSSTLGGNINGKSFNVPFFNWGWNYVVSSRSIRKELAYLFCLFASTPQVSIYSVREANGYFDPYRKEHYQDPVIQDVYGQPFLEAHKESLANSIPDFYLQGQGLYLSALKEGIYAANLGHVNIKLALNRIAQKWEQITNQLGRRGQMAQWRYLKNSYPEYLKNLLV